MSNEQYVPSEAEMISGMVQIPGEPAGLYRHVNADEMERALLRVRRDAAREALDGLVEDVWIDVRLGVEGGDNLRVQNAEAVIDAARIYRDTEYPKETP